MKPRLSHLIWIVVDCGHSAHVSLTRDDAMDACDQATDLTRVLELAAEDRDAIGGGWRDVTEEFARESADRYYRKTDGEDPSFWPPRFRERIGDAIWSEFIDRYEEQQDEIRRYGTDRQQHSTYRVPL